MDRGRNKYLLMIAALAYALIANAAFAQNQPQRPPAGGGIRGGELPPPQAPSGLVYISQVIDLTDQIAEDEEVYSLDGEPLPRMRTTNVTLGVLIDDKGHIVTRLSNVSPNGPAPEVRIITPQSQVATARFIGMDAVTGLCVLQVEGNLTTKPVRVSTLAKVEKLPLQRQVNLLGFHPNQAGGKVNVAALVRPRLHPSEGSIVKAEKDFRFSRSNPIYQLTIDPPLRSVQDGSFVVENDGSVFGLVSYDTSGDGLHLVYPLTRIKRIAEMVIQARHSIPHGWLGATSVSNLAPAAATPNKASRRGIRVAAVFPDSPADVAGVKPHDIL
ncbi:MAG TPA: S1C family serine protease, partial [Blastocatellia bacterium]|nr:S1C family serine protease [Blastocatellia bacterium]